jgi:ABC transporter substrate binding protein
MTVTGLKIRKSMRRAARSPRRSNGVTSRTRFLLQCMSPLVARSCHPRMSVDVRYRGHIGREILTASISHGIFASENRPLTPFRGWQIPAVIRTRSAWSQPRAGNATTRFDCRNCCSGVAFRRARAAGRACAPHWRDHGIRRDRTGLARSPLTATRRAVIIELAARLRLPTIYSFRFYAESGGLVSYGIDQTELVREAASYVDRILRGANPGELPVQLPTKYQLVINIRAAKALGLNIPNSIQLLADEVIE